MKFPIIETAIGTPNGVRTDFETTLQFKPGSLRVWINGVVTVPAQDDGVIELGPKKFRLKEAPLSKETVRVYYLPL